MKFEQHYDDNDRLSKTDARKYVGKSMKKFKEIYGHLIHHDIGGRPGTGYVIFKELREELERQQHYTSED